MKKTTNKASYCKKINKAIKNIENLNCKFEVACYLDIVNLLSDLDWFPNREELLYLGRFDEWVRRIIDRRENRNCIDRNCSRFLYYENG